MQCRQIGVKTSSKKRTSAQMKCYIWVCRLPSPSFAQLAACLGGVRSLELEGVRPTRRREGGRDGGRCSGDTRVMLGRCSGDARAMLKRCSGDARAMLGRCSRDVWAMFGRCLGNDWAMLKQCLGDARVMLRQCSNWNL